MNALDRNSLLSQKGKPVLGYRSAKRLVEKKKASLVVVASNCPQPHVKILEKGGVRVETFNGDSRELGVIYGKPFNVSVVAFG